MLELTATLILNNSPARSNSFLLSRAVSDVSSGTESEWEIVTTLSRSSSQTTICPEETAQQSASVPPLSDFSSALATLARPKPRLALQSSPQSSPQPTAAPLSRASTLDLQSHKSTPHSKACKSSIGFPLTPDNDGDTEMIRLVQELAKNKDIPDWKPRVTQLKLLGVMESRVWISDAYTASRMSSLEIGPCQRVAHVLFLCNEGLVNRVNARNPELAKCDDCPERWSEPRNLLDIRVLEKVCSWISKGLIGSDTMNHAVLLVSATGSTYAPAMALAYRIWSSLELIPDTGQLVHELSETGHTVRLNPDCIARLTRWRNKQNDYLTEILSYGRVNSQTDVLKKDNSWFWDGKYAKPMPRQDSGASEYVWHNI